MGDIRGSEIADDSSKAAIILALNWVLSLRSICADCVGAIAGDAHHRQALQGLVGSDSRESGVLKVEMLLAIRAVTANQRLSHFDDCRSLLGTGCVNAITAPSSMVTQAYH